MDIPTFSFSSFLSSSWRLNSPLYCIPSLCFLLLWSRTIVAIFDQPYSASPSPSPSTTFLHPSSLPPWLRYIPSPKNLVAILHPSMSASGHHSSINTSFFSWDMKLLSFSQHISFSVSISSALSLATSFLFPWWSTLNQLLPSLPCPSQQAFSLHFSQLTLPFSLSDRCWFPSSTTSCLLGLLSPSARGSSSLLPPRTVPSCLRASVPPLLAALVEHQQSPISGCHSTLLSHLSWCYCLPLFQLTDSEYVQLKVNQLITFRWPTSQTTATASFRLKRAVEFPWSCYLGAVRYCRTPPSSTKPSSCTLLG